MHPTTIEWLQTGGTAVMHMLAQGAAMLAVTWGIAAIARNASATLRYHIWAGGLLATLAIPLVAAGIAPVDIRLFAAREETPREATALEVTVPAEGGSPSVAAPWPQGTAATRIPMGRLVLAVWLAGALVMTVRVLRGYAAHRHRMRAAAKVTDRRRIACDDISQAMHLPRVRVVETPRVRSAAVCGLTHPTVMLPVASRSWCVTTLRAVLTHELAHVRRMDLWMLPLLQLLRIVQWPNPLAWLTIHRLEQSREQACDDTVLKSGTLASNYAESLLALAQHSGRRPAVALPFSHRSSLDGRVRHVLARRRRTEPGRIARAALAAGFVLLLTGVASVQPWAHVPRAEAHAAGDTGTLGLIDHGLDSRNPATRRIAARAARDLLERLPLAEVVRSMSSPHTGVRAHAAHVLGDRREAAAVATLVAALGDPAVRVRERAAWALAEVAHRDAVAALLETAQADANDSVRRQAIRALGEIGDPTAGPQLIDLLQHGNPGLRAQAADALGDLRYAPAVPHLEAHLDDANSGVRRNARTALRRIQR